MVKEVRCGLLVHYLSDLASAVQNATNCGFNFIATPLVAPRSKQFTPHSDLQLSSADWSSLVVGQMTDFDFENDVTRSSANMESEITYAVHLGLSALMFECPASVKGITQLARILNGRLSSSGGAQNLPFFWLQVPIHSPIDGSNAWRSDLETEVKSEDTWLRWNRFRSHVSTDKRVGIALEMNDELPDQIILDRWAGEPIKAVILPTSIFQTNRRGYPVLAKAHQLFIRKLIGKMSNHLSFIIKGHNVHNDIKHYIQYIEHIRTTQLPEDIIAQFARGYEDYLQIPLQPLMDNLESCTYEVFEKDPIKYQEYGKAITQALKDLNTTEEIVIMVVGAGRGPLVEASRNAAKEVQKKIQIYAVEKNPNAIVTLQTLWQQKWGAEEGTEWAVVQVVACDMREWEAPRKADIVISELLGSFGDNELSPECLDGVWSYVKESAISIPSAYTSYLAPISSHRLYSEASYQRDRSQPIYSAFETGYVVYMRNFFAIDSPKPVFTFEHHNLLAKPSERDNTRFTSLEFKSQVDTVCHGFAGYFDATLYGDIKISTVPATHTPGMFSWFPIYFPIHDPLFIGANQDIKVQFWRLTNKRQIWYEWCFSEPTQTKIHNPNGRTYSIGLF